MAVVKAAGTEEAGLSCRASPGARPLPEISIIIPHLNEPEALRRCLASLDAQRYGATPYEIIVADNGSRTSPEAICAAFTSTRLVVEPNPGPGPARNLGASIAQAEILAFIDADCVAEPGWIERIVDFFNDNAGVDFLGGSIGIAARRPERMTAVEAYEAVFSYRTRMFVERDHYAATGNMAVRTSVFWTVGPFEGIARHEDKTWGSKAVAQGFRIAYLGDARVLTSGCLTYRDLARRIDIHVAHEFSDLSPGLLAKVRWTMVGLAMAVSPIWGLGTILRSKEISGARARSLAFACLARIRAYRARRTLELLFHDWTGDHLQSWNRIAGGPGPPANDEE